MDLQERGAVGGVPAPALTHKLVHLRGAAWGTLHPVAGLQELVDVRQLDAGVRGHSVGGNLPQEDAESPDVRLGGELVVGQALGGSPLDGELGTGMGRVGVVADQPS